MNEVILYTKINISGACVQAERKQKFRPYLIWVMPT